MRVAITGGAGFIGHNLAIYLYRAGFSPLVFDSLERSSPLALRRLASTGLRVVKGDVRNGYALKSVVKNVDVVVHAAAYVSVEESFIKPAEYMSNNVGGTASVASVCNELGKPLIYLSSAAVYGNPVKTPIPEDHPLNPLSPYGLSKLLGEKVVEFYGTLGLKYTIIRPFNVYGIGQTGYYAGVVSRFVERSCRNEPLEIHGDGLQSRDFIHVEDLSRLVELVITREAWGHVFNAGTGVPTRILDLAAIVLELTGSKGGVIYLDRRPGDIFASWADITRARRILGFEPRISLRDGLRELVEHYCGTRAR